jgi:hypothetical protein
MIKTKKMHKCPKCEYETKYTTNLKLHLNRKTPCDRNKKSGSQMDPNGSKIKKSGSRNNLQCECCLKIFSFKTNLTKHIRLNICKKKNKDKKEEDIEYVIEDVNENILSNSELTETVLELKFQLEEIKKINKDKKEEDIKYVIEDENENILSNGELTETVLELKFQLEKIKKIKEKPSIIIKNKTQNNIIINNSSIKDAFQQGGAHPKEMDSNVFWSGPDMVIKLIKEVLFRNKIECIDISRQVYKYIMNGKEVKDVKGFQIQEKISNQYKDQTLKIRDQEIIKYEDKPGYVPIIQQQADKHIKTATDNNYFSNKLVKNLGKTVTCN